MLLLLALHIRNYAHAHKISQDALDSRMSSCLQRPEVAPCYKLTNLAAGESAELKLAKCGGKQEKRGELSGTVKDAQGHTAWTISGSYMDSVCILFCSLPAMHSQSKACTYNMPDPGHISLATSSCCPARLWQTTWDMREDHGRTMNQYSRAS